MDEKSYITTRLYNNEEDAYKSMRRLKEILEIKFGTTWNIGVRENIGFFPYIVCINDDGGGMIEIIEDLGGYHVFFRPDGPAVGHHKSDVILAIADLKNKLSSILNNYHQEFSKMLETIDKSTGVTNE